jgi:polyisoprenoid-binding protein YceI
VARYRVVPERSKLWVDARSSVHPIKVESNAVEGSLELEVVEGRADLASAPKGSIAVDVESLKTGSKLEDRELERQLQARKYPRVRGEVREVTALNGGGRYRVRGDLSLRGVTKSIEGEVTLQTLDEKTVQVDGEKTLDVRDFGLQPPKILMLQVYPEVRIRARIVAVREG